MDLVEPIGLVDVGRFGGEAATGYQGVIQFSVPLYLGIFTRLGNRQGAVGGMVAGLATVATLELAWPGTVPWAYGLTSGVLALAVNLGIYLAAHILLPRRTSETARLDRLFGSVASPGASMPCVH